MLVHRSVCISGDTFFSQDTPGEEIESEGTAEHQEQDELMSEDDVRILLFAHPFAA